MSAGEYCTLGHYEKEDLGRVLRQLNNDKDNNGKDNTDSAKDNTDNTNDKVTNMKFMLWGFSMGAATCLLYTSYMEKLSQEGDGEKHCVVSMVS